MCPNQSSEENIIHLLQKVLSLTKPIRYRYALYAMKQSSAGHIRSQN